MPPATSSVTSGTIATLRIRVHDTPGVQVASDFPLPTQSRYLRQSEWHPAPLFAVAEQDGQDQINFQVPHFLVPQQLTIVVGSHGKEQVLRPELGEQLGIFGSRPLEREPLRWLTGATRGANTIYWTEISGYDFDIPRGSLRLCRRDPVPPSILACRIGPQVKIGDLARM